jgi:ApaG protein
MNPTIDISVKTRFVEEQSVAEKGQFVFAYTITIANQSTTSVQLISRHWIITDNRNQIQEVKGVGVIGQQPVLAPGSSFTYTSSAMLATETGTMEGSYQMCTENNENFSVPIPAFLLIHPKKLH